MRARDQLRFGYASTYNPQRLARFEALLDQVEAEALTAAATALTTAADRDQPDVPGVAGYRAGLRAAVRIVEGLHGGEVAS